MSSTVIIIEGTKFTLEAVTEGDRCEFERFMADLEKSEPKLLKQVVSQLDVIANSGLPVNEERCRKLKGSKDIWEFKRGQIRIL